MERVKFSRLIKVKLAEAAIFKRCKKEQLHYFSPLINGPSFKYTEKGFEGQGLIGCSSSGVTYRKSILGIRRTDCNQVLFFRFGSRESNSSSLLIYSLDINFTYRQQEGRHQTETPILRRIRLSQLRTLRMLASPDLPV